MTYKQSFMEVLYMTDEEVQDYIYYIINVVAFVIAMIFSLSDAYGGGQEALLYNGPLVALAFFFKFIYLLYYAVMKFAMTGY